VLVFGESLGAWTSSDVVMFQGIEGFDHYRIDRALWVGLPWQDAYPFPAASEQQIGRIEQTLVSLELERAERIKAQHAQAAPLPPAHRDAADDELAGVPLRTRRTRGARWVRGRGGSLHR
jgi:hypothetical protein